MRRKTRIVIIVYLYCKFMRKPRLSLEDIHQSGVLQGWGAHYKLHKAHGIGENKKMKL